ncbi:hypothetical protein KJ636_04595, partial [Patescibacteria group bacterium]|nr:hypothetical protein [Patescibacteria group bacterium]
GLIIAITIFAIRKQNKIRETKIKNTQPEDEKKKDATKFEKNKTSKSPAETLTEEFEEAYKRTGDPGLGIILQFRQMDAEIEKLRDENRQKKLRRNKE